ncbi:MAG: putative porin [Verrucomicrobiota bacterium]
MKKNSRLFLHRLTLLAGLAAWPLLAQDATPTPDSPPSIDELLPLPVEEPGEQPAAQAPLAPAAQPRVQLSESFAINLVNRLVERGVLTQADAQDMITLAKADAQAAAQEREALFTAAQTAAEAPPASDDEVRVTYIPEVVKDEMRSQIKSELLREAEKKKWLTPQYELPQWVSTFHPHAEFRVRYESISFPGGNSNTGAFPNFNAINTGPAYDEMGVLFAPQVNTDQDRQRARLLLRFGAELDLDDNFTLGIRLGTGDTNSPVSGNQSFGYANQTPGGAAQQQGGQFSKYAIWLDRAFLRWEPVESISISVGRFDNPFFSTTAIYSDDLGFDGIVLSAHHEVYEGVDPFLVIGTFPIFNSDLHVASNQPAKFESKDKWLNAAQIGVDWKISKDWNLKLATAYYDFRNVEGQLSSPYVPRNIEDPGDTDHTRPTFAQKGNSYRRLRRIIADATNNNGTINQFQYYGLATPFRVHSITGRLDYNGYEPVQVSMLGEYLRNTAFDAAGLEEFAVNNPGGDGAFGGGDTAYYFNLRVGKPQMEKRGDWNAYIGYRHVESDAVIDGFNDQDFGGGGTNMKGYTLGAAIALSQRVQIGLRYFSASQIAGPQFKSDIIQLDLSAKF